MGSCEEHVRNKYCISEAADLYLYIHKYQNPQFKIPILGMEVFILSTTFNGQTIVSPISIDVCINYNIPINYISSVDINEEEINKYNPFSDYYNDDSLDSLTIYKRKKDYNEQNLSLCQTNTNFTLYNSTSKTVTCNGYILKTNFTKNVELLDKFILPEMPTEQIHSETTNIDIDEDNDTNIDSNKGIDTDENSILYNTSGIINNISEFINILIKNQNETTGDAASIFTGILKAITDGSLSNLVNQVVDEESSMKIPVNNDIYELSTLKKQSEELTYVDLGDCEEKLRIKHGLGDQKLLILKVDHNVTGFKIPIIEYVILSENGRINIDLNECKDININLLIPVKLNTSMLYLYNPDNEFYNDICTQHTSDGGTDMTLFDRQDQYNIQNMSVCESGCEFKNYDETTGKVKCECPIKTEHNFYGIDPDKLLNKFKNVKQIINIMIVKCVKLVFSSDGLKKNIGSYIIIGITTVSIILTILFYKVGLVSFKNFINEIINKKFNEKNLEKNNINPEFPPKKEDNKRRMSKSKNKRNSVMKNVENKINVESEEVLNVNDNENIKRRTSIKDDKQKNKKRRKSLKSESKIKFEKETDDSNINISAYLNDFELNNLSYDDDLKYDKSNFCKYYLSLLKTKHLIIFTFYTKTDYNSRILKIILFLLSFTLFYTVNALFFTDSTMHQIYEDEGAFNFVYQIPQILYSTVISTVIKFIISFLSLTEKNFSKINNNCKTKKEAKEEMNKIFSSASKKFIAFFSINFILLIIFWYYLSCFCAVYKNTQVYLIKDTLLSFAISLLYPFALNFLPAILRIPAIKSKKKCLFVVSTYVAII